MVDERRRFRDLSEFKFTQTHLRLIRRMYVGWQDCETGAPEIDPKRPYGNPDVETDVAEILEWEIGEDLTEGERAEAFRLHRETEIALQLHLRGLRPENYARLNSWDKWERKK